MLRRLGIPWNDFRFWIIQFLVLGIDIGHLVLEQVQLLVGESELYLLSISAFLVPVVYAGLTFGLKGALPTAIWALVLSIPEISLHGWTTRAGILIQFGIVIAIGMIVAIRRDRERSAARALEQANQRLSRAERNRFSGRQFIGSEPRAAWHSASHPQLQQGAGRVDSNETPPRPARLCR